MDIVKIYTNLNLRKHVIILTLILEYFNLKFEDGVQNLPGTLKTLANGN